MATQLNFNKLASYGVNSVRMYTPSTTLVATAALNNLTALVGFPLPWLAIQPSFYTSAMTTVPATRWILAAVQQMTQMSSNAVLAWCARRLTPACRRVSISQPLDSACASLAAGSSATTSSTARRAPPPA